MELLVALVALLAFDLAAWRWGADTRDTLANPDVRRG